MRRVALGLALALAACSPAPSDPRAAAGTWPPKDYEAFTARPPMSVGAELDDPWTMAIEAERWSYVIGVAVVAVGGTPGRIALPLQEDYLRRADRALQLAVSRLTELKTLTCGTPSIAKAEDCATFAPPSWVIATPAKEDVQTRLQWLEADAHKFVQPACAIAIKRTGNERYCVAE